MFGDLPPSSSEIFFSVAAAAPMMILPTAALPVNAILSTSGRSARAAVMLEAGRDVGHVERRFHNRLARVARLELGELIGAPAHDLGELEEDAPAVLRGRVLPRAGVERRACGGDRFRDVAGAGIRHASNRLAGRRIDDVDRRARRRGDEFAVYVKRRGGQGQAPTILTCA